MAACGVVALSALPVGQAEPSHCFRNVSLKSTYSVQFEPTGDKVAGVFMVEPDEGEAQRYPFTGTRHHNRLVVDFPAEKVPAILTKQRPLVWLMHPAKGGDTLQVRIYGQNYQTRKYSNYNITLKACSPPAGG
jgi:hypothetical protein